MRLEWPKIKHCEAQAKSVMVIKNLECTCQKTEILIQSVKSTLTSLKNVQGLKHVQLCIEGEGLCLYR